MFASKQKFYIKLVLYVLSWSACFYYALIANTGEAMLAMALTGTMLTMIIHSIK